MLVVSLVDQKANDDDLIFWLYGLGGLNVVCSEEEIDGDFTKLLYIPNEIEKKKMQYYCGNILVQDKP